MNRGPAQRTPAEFLGEVLETMEKNRSAIILDNGPLADLRTFEADTRRIVIQVLANLDDLVVDLIALEQFVPTGDAA